MTCNFCIYEKSTKQVVKLVISIADTPIINWFEISFKYEKAINKIENMLITCDAEKVAFVIIIRYMRFAGEDPDEIRLN